MGIDQTWHDKGVGVIQYCVFRRKGRGFSRRSNRGDGAVLYPESLAATRGIFGSRKQLPTLNYCTHSRILSGSSSEYENYAARLVQAE